MAVEGCPGQAAVDRGMGVFWRIWVLSLGVYMAIFVIFLLFVFLAVILSN